MIHGSCLCEGVCYEVEHAAGLMAHRHCQMCRKAHGSAFSTVLPVPREGFRWTEGKDLVTSFESSPGKRRWFCRRRAEPSSVKRSTPGPPPPKTDGWGRS